MAQTASKITKALNYTGPNKLGSFLSQFKVYPALTAKLDGHRGAWTQEQVNEVVLWKVDRYVDLPPAVLTALNDVKGLQAGEHGEAEETLRMLLECDNVRLAMASTLLRFVNPDVFQIYDRRMCRALYGKFLKQSPKNPNQAIPLYWQYLDELRRQCGLLQVKFRDSDRILFEFDKATNPTLSGAEE